MLTREYLLGLAKEYGTPLFVYDGDMAVGRYRELYDFIPCSRLQVFYALKANYNPGLAYHANYCKGVVKIYFALSRDDVEAARQAFAELVDYLSEVEEDIQLYFDLCLFVQRTRQIIAGK